MSDSTIRPGDKYILIKGCPQCGHGFGSVRTCEKIETLYFRNWWCRKCQCEKICNDTSAVLSIEGGKAPLSWCRKLPPDSNVQGDTVADMFSRRTPSPLDEYDKARRELRDQIDNLKKARDKLHNR